ncbi:hypothetical protein G7Y89_g13218 [Cudoniella acicularis]|uniref:Cupin type-2 domain-containing protein n=1 Tax=Cudoniella acicularis TaxID=354080 RepID=A0A8H4R7U0_9HELO|nr:hypothetical protein G7Y89_g13218 [Cudoniella acicularis]
MHGRQIVTKIGFARSSADYGARNSEATHQRWSRRPRKSTQVFTDPLQALLEAHIRIQQNTFHNFHIRIQNPVQTDSHPNTHRSSTTGLSISKRTRMSAPKIPETDRGLSHPKRFITDHDSNGKAIFAKSLQEDIPFEQIPNDAIFSLCYATNRNPVDMSSNADIKTYTQYLDNKPGIMIPGGSVLRMVDMPPGATSPMHRTTSLDYGVVLVGDVRLVLDSGETREMRQGDMSVQRGTMHAWENMSSTNWARMLYILLDAQKLEVNGKALGENYGGLQVPASGS